MAKYYVAPDGDDTNPGTIDQPWASMLKAKEMAYAGDTVYCRGGTYLTREDSSGYGPIFNHSGTPDQPITFRNYPGEQPIFDGTGRSVPFWVSASYIVLNGLEIKNVGNYTICFIGDHNTIENCIFHGGPSAPDLVKVLRNADYAIVRYNEFYGGNHLHLDFMGNYGDIYGNYFHDRDGDISVGQAVTLLLKAECHDIQLHHNLFERCPPSGSHESWPSCVIEVGGYTAPWFRTGERFECEDALVYNNVIVDSEASGIYFWEAKNCAAYNNTIVGRVGRTGISVFGNTPSDVHKDHSENITIKNNIVIGGTTASLYVADGSELGLDVDYNLWNRPEGEEEAFCYGFRASESGLWTRTDLAGWRTHSGCSGNGMWAEPSFADEAGEDFHLLSDSPAIDAGVYELGVPSDDFDGNFRPYGDAIDIGAYEYQEGGAVVSEHYFEPIDRTVIVNEAAGNAAGVDFVRKQKTYSISGRVTDEYMNPITGITVIVDGQSVLTDIAGQFIIEGLSAGTYVVTPQAE